MGCPAHGFRRTVSAPRAAESRYCDGIGSRIRLPDKTGNLARLYSIHGLSRLLSGVVFEAFSHWTGERPPRGRPSRRLLRIRAIRVVETVDSVGTVNLQPSLRAVAVDDITAERSRGRLVQQNFTGPLVNHSHPILQR